MYHNSKYMQYMMKKNSQTFFVPVHIKYKETFFFYPGWTTLLVYLLSRQIGDMYKCIIEAGKNVSHSKNIFTLLYLGAKNNLFCLFLLPFTRGHLQNTKKYDKVYISYYL